ncbi:MAG: carboxypeptidase-like regulatory domain-containing protein [Flavitalea sp.]
MSNYKVALLLIVLFPLSCIVRGNNGGNGEKNPIILGFVSDALSRKPVKGVTISFTSTKDKVEKFVTDANGNFSVPQLPAGEVTIILEKKGYKTYRREKLLLKEGMQVKLNFDISNDETADDNKVFHPLLRMMEW